MTPAYAATPAADRYLRVVAYDHGVRVVDTRWTPAERRAGFAYAMRWRAAGRYDVRTITYADTGTVHGPPRMTADDVRRWMTADLRAGTHTCPAWHPA